MHKRKTISAVLQWVQVDGREGWIPETLWKNRHEIDDDGLIILFDPRDPKRDSGLFIHDLFHHEALGLPYDEFGEAIAEVVGPEYPTRPTTERQACRNAAADSLRRLRGGANWNAWYPTFSEWKSAVNAALSRARAWYGKIKPSWFVEVIEDAMQKVWEEDTFYTERWRLTIRLESREVTFTPVGGWRAHQRRQREED